jgi:hypothetical protein
MVEVKCCHRKKPKPERNQVKKKFIEAKKGTIAQAAPIFVETFKPLSPPELSLPFKLNTPPVSTPVLDVNAEEVYPPCYHCHGPELFLQYTLPQENFGQVENFGFTTHFSAATQDPSP